MLERQSRCCAVLAQTVLCQRLLEASQPQHLTGAHFARYLAGGAAATSAEPAGSRAAGQGQQQQRQFQHPSEVSDPNAALRELAASSQSVAPSMVPALVDAMAYDAKALHAQAANARSLASKTRGGAAAGDGATGSRASSCRGTQPTLTPGLTQAVNEG